MSEYLPPGCGPMLDLAAPSVTKREEVLDPALGWAGRQGAAYSVRNPKDIAGMDESYVKRFGITRTAVNEWALEGVPRTASVLEVGCASGVQLNGLEAVGFTHLGGCDLSDALMKDCPYPKRIADGRALPYESESFDMVMTAGTLMQIPPGSKKAFMDECYRVAKRWIYGVEGASIQSGTWDFGGLIPPAWTDLVPESILQPGWKVVRSRWLHPIFTSVNNKMSLRAYLLERE